MPHACVRDALAALAPQAQKLLLAVSGGVDSVALLRLLHEMGYGLEVAHFDHALRTDSAEDAAFVQVLCEGLELPFHTERTDVGRIAEAKGWNLEDAARRLRYGFLTRTAKRIGAEAVVTAHTQDDQAETVLMQLLRGAAHLKGMPARQGNVIRPLLGVARADLLNYLEALKQAYRTDATNADTTRTRAWIRHKLLPLLESRYPQAKRTLAQLATLQRGQAEHLERLAGEMLDEKGLSVPKLLKADEAVQLEALAQALKRAGIAPELTQLRTLQAHLTDTTPFRLSLSPTHTARLAYGRLELVTPTRAQQEKLEGLPEEVDEGKLEPFPHLTFRTRQPGDRIRLAGGSKKLSDLLIDRKVPREERDSLRLLASGSEVLWLEGVAVDVRVAKAGIGDEMRFMREALALAQAAGEGGELPVGAVVVKGGEIIGRGANSTERDDDPSAHAEMHAIREATRVLGDWRLSDCVLYVTLEPCPMCFGVILQSHLPRVVYGATNHREGALGGVSDLNTLAWKRKLEVKGGLLEREARRLLSNFFRARRM